MRRLPQSTVNARSHQAPDRWVGYVDRDPLAGTYEMDGLDIRNFVGSVLNWSGVVDVLYCEEFFEAAD